MNQNPIEEILDELHFTNTQKDGFWKFINYAKACQETGNNRSIKSQLEEIIKLLASES